MKWLEIIELRSVGTKRIFLEAQLQKLIDDVEKEANKQIIKVYNHVTIDVDFSIHLLHDSANVEQEGSPLGLQLAFALKEFGMVNHSVWIEMFNKSKRG